MDRIRPASTFTSSKTPHPVPPSDMWPEPKALPNGLLPVASFNPAFLPDSIRPWVSDISERIQCPPDFVGVSAVTALGATLGRKIGIRPQRRTDWLEVPNLWACIVGRPGAMKTPATSEAIKPLTRLEQRARETYEADRQVYDQQLEVVKIRKEEAARDFRKAITAGKHASNLLAVDEPLPPVAKRYVVHDTSYEALGEIMASNPYGVLAFRDELVSLLKTLDREDNAAARGFYLTSWNGTSSYTFDRIVRGKKHIDGVCLSLLGATQPGKIAEYIRRAISGGAGDDGLIQRFGLLVWPDQSPTWTEIDRFPDTEARQLAWATFDHLDALSPEAVGAEHEDYDSLPFLRFDDAASAVFSEWRADLEKRLRSDELSPALESHLSKYRKLIPALSLVNHLADAKSGLVSEASTVRALAFAEYLETHARRVYGAGIEAETAAAKAILKRIRSGDLKDGFTARDIRRKEWSTLTSADHIHAGLDLLVDYDWLRAERETTGGRDKVVYTANPRALR